MPITIATSHRRDVVELDRAAGSRAIEEVAANGDEQHPAPIAMMMRAIWSLGFCRPLASSRARDRAHAERDIIGMPS
ncbi:MAG: hypothetical protein HS111_07445 [Kofleriaceae bacterium]|nr:hypothetical protein [Kofleriaceae bacterium]